MAKDSAGEILKKARVSAGLTQRQVADHFNYGTPQFISNWERGVSQPPMTILKTLEGLYKRPLFEVLLFAAMEDLRVSMSMEYNYGKGKTKKSKPKK